MDAKAGKSVNIAIMTVSDTRTLEDDKSGNTLVERAEKAGHSVVDRQIVVDEIGKIQEWLKKWIADGNVDVVISTGGTGVTGRDVTPEAFEALYDKPIPGFGELFRQFKHGLVHFSDICFHYSGINFSVNRVDPFIALFGKVVRDSPQLVVGFLMTDKIHKLRKFCWLPLQKHFFSISKTRQVTYSKINILLLKQ